MALKSPSSRTNTATVASFNDVLAMKLHETIRRGTASTRYAVLMMSTSVSSGRVQHDRCYLKCYVQLTPCHGIMIDSCKGGVFRHAHVTLHCKDNRYCAVSSFLRLQLLGHWQAQAVVGSALLIPLVQLWMLGMHLYRNFKRILIYMCKVRMEMCCLLKCSS